MSCNGCRVLRKGCSEGCVLRHCLQCIDSPEAQAHATLFVTKFFGRAGLTGFINGVPENQRPALFQSLLYEACGRTVNPVYGAVGLLFSGKWTVCQAAVETVLRGGSPKAAAIDVSTNHMKPNLTISALNKNHAAGSTSTLDPPPGIIKTTFAALIDDVKHIRRHPPALESSLATSASSFKASSLHAAENHCVLDFSNYSTSSSAEEMIKRSQHFNKRPRDGKTEIKAEEDPMLKRARSSFLNGSSAADPCDAAHFTGRPPSIMAWIEGFNKANCRRIDSNDCMIKHADVYAPARRDNPVVLGAEIKHAARDCVRANASNGSAKPGTHHDQQLLVAPVARRIYTPQPILKQGQNHGGVQHMATSKNRSNNYESSAGGNHYQAQPCTQSDRKEGVHSWSYSARRDAMPDHACGVDAIDIKLNLGLQAQDGELYCDHGEFVSNSAHETQELNIMKHEEPQALLRMSSPSVNSEGSVNTLVGGLNRSCCTANFESPKKGLKLLNLLL